MRLLERRLEKLEKLEGGEQGGWPWVKLLWRSGEPEPLPPPRHNVVIRKIVSPDDPPDWLQSRCVQVVVK